MAHFPQRNAVYGGHQQFYSPHHLNNNHSVGNHNVVNHNVGNHNVGHFVIPEQQPHFLANFPVTNTYWGNGHHDYNGLHHQTVVNELSPRELQPHPTQMLNSPGTEYGISMADTIYSNLGRRGGDLFH
jgi:hypothetical protein